MPGREKEEYLFRQYQKQLQYDHNVQTQRREASARPNIMKFGKRGQLSHLPNHVGQILVDRFRSCRVLTPGHCANILLLITVDC